LYTKLLIPLDGSKTAEQVLPHARFLTNRLHKPVEIVAAVEIAEILAYVSAEKAVDAYNLIERGVRDSEAYLKAVSALLDGADVQCTVEKGRAEDVILEKGAADRGTLIAMATHGRSGVNRWLLGSVTEKVLRATVNPLLLIRATEHAEPDAMVSVKSLVVPLDGSALAESVLPTVAALAKQLDLAVILFRSYVIPYSVYGYGHGYYAVDVQTLSAEMVAVARGYLEQKLAELKSLGVEKVTSLVKEGLSADAIIELARESPDSLIVMCSHGRSGMKRWVLGSVTESVVRHADNPLLVLRPALPASG